LKSFSLTSKHLLPIMKNRILHLALSSNFTEGLAYQENLLCKYDILNGNESFIITNPFSFINGELKHNIGPSFQKIDCGAYLYRVPYFRFVPTSLAKRLQAVRGLNTILQEISPNIILCHGIAGLAFLAIYNYKKLNHNVQIFVDSHEDYFNSSQNKLIRFIQYRLIYRGLYRLISKDVQSVLCVSIDTMDFVKNYIGIEYSKIVYFPLGSEPVSEFDWSLARKNIRDKFSFAENSIVFVHTGKFNSGKCTRELIESFLRINDSRAKLILAGYISSDEYGSLLLDLINESDSILFVGWQSYLDLQEILCGCDCYLQPGSQSATLQQALGSRLPVILRAYISHIPYVQGNGLLIRTNEDIFFAMRQFLDLDRATMKRMSDISYSIAKNTLDYRVLSQVYSPVCKES
jgi:1,2-diacylglycerol 3-alpha-glucosyltransferase